MPKKVGAANSAPTDIELSDFKNTHRTAQEQKQPAHAVDTIERAQPTEEQGCWECLCSWFCWLGCFLCDLCSAIGCCAEDYCRCFSDDQDDGYCCFSSDADGAPSTANSGGTRGAQQENYGSLEGIEDRLNRWAGDMGSYNFEQFKLSCKVLVFVRVCPVNADSESATVIAQWHTYTSDRRKNRLEKFSTRIKGFYSTVKNELAEKGIKLEKGSHVVRMTLCFLETKFRSNASRQVTVYSHGSSSVTPLDKVETIKTATTDQWQGKLRELGIDEQTLKAFVGTSRWPKANAKK